MSEPHRRDESGAASTWRGAGIQAIQLRFLLEEHVLRVFFVSGGSSATPHAKHRKRAHMAVFSMFGGFFTLPVMLDTKNMPLRAFFSCSVSSSPHPSHRTPKTCPPGTFFVFGVLLSLAPPTKSQKHMSPTPFNVAGRRNPTGEQVNVLGPPPHPISCHPTNLHLSATFDFLSY